MNVKPTLQVKVGQFLTDKFTLEKGIKQGDVLSPNLFKLYIIDIVIYFGNDCMPAKLGNIP